MQQLPNRHGSLRAASSSSVVSIQARPDKNSPGVLGHVENRPGVPHAADGLRHAARGARHAAPHKRPRAAPGTTQKLPCGIRCHTSAPMRHPLPHKCSHAASVTTQVLPCGIRYHTSAPVWCPCTTFKLRAVVFYHTNNSCGTSAPIINELQNHLVHLCR